ncbi:hypothetical protein H6781_01235 [Candidatus Nomurabacteria bacterium]|nr:hypothetical protein [Candidatus Nomurabacteria bacterium]MCB9818147.1 hypothetical protein [Candidatus Nomurabacteria bacterium]
MRKLVVMLLITTFVFTDFDTILDWPLLFQAFAAEVTIDDTPSTNGLSHTAVQPTTVFISDQVGYKFYRDGSGGGGTNGTCVYKKTTNGGTSWGTETIVDSQTDCEAIVVWYDKWTPGDAGSYIHIATMDSGDDDLWYNRLDTTSDTLLMGSNPTSTSLTQSAMSITAATANHSMTKGTDGTLYMSISDNTDRFVVSCSSGCGTGSNWTEVGDGTFMDLDEDITLLLPLDGGNILLINRDISANDIRSKVWNGSSWSASWSTVDANAVESGAYDIQMSAVRSPVTGDIYLAYIADANNFTVADHDIRLAKYSGGSWSNLPDLITDDTRGLTSISLTVDENTDTVYVAYSARTTLATADSANVYWATSTSAMTSWGAEQGPVNTSSGNFYGVSFNYSSVQRLYVTWFGAVVDDLFGETIADVAPATTVDVSGTQETEVRASTTDFYVGGKFVITEESASRNVTDIVITENGSVDASTGLNNIKLRYDLDTSSPYDCASESYGGGESQFGSTDTNGFSGADGTSAFSGSVSVSPTQAMCVYVVMDVLKEAADSSDIEIEIANPSTDVLVSGGVTAIPETVKLISGTTNVVDSDLTQTHFHWRNDDGNETGATSRTAGVEDVPLLALQQEVPRRLRFGVSNEGSTSSLPTTLRLEYALNTSSCDLATGWTDVDAVNDDWNMYDSTFVTDGTDTTDIGIGIGGVSNENSVLLSPNGGQKDTSSTVGPLTLLPTNWVETEFSIVASTSATEGNTYCFRLTNNGEELPVYTNYPRATIAADVKVSATSSQISTVDIPTPDFYVGGKFSIIENESSRNVTSITITENGTVDGTTGVENIRLFYDLDTSFPYDCASENYVGGEAQFGTASSSFSSANGSSTFTGSVAITTTQAMCVYTVLDVTSSANNGETLDISINSGSQDVLVSGGGSVGPLTALDITGSTTLAGGIVTLTNYHWRNDDGTETGATSATGGSEDTPLTDFSIGSPIRLRIGLSNEGGTSSVPQRYGLEYGIKSSTCEDIAVWTDADGGGVSWSMHDSGFLTNGEDTTDIAEVNGGVSDPNSSFLSSNGGVRDTESFSATTTLTETEYVDLEYSITSTFDTPYESTYCFRVTQNGSPLLQYDVYPEISIEAKRDFKIQRGTTTVSGTSGVTLTAGVDYVAPSASTSAFVRITNAHHTGAGKDTLGGNQNSDDYTVYILNPGNIETSFTLMRDTDSINNSYVAWEIIEYVGPVGGDNEIIVRDQSVVSYSNSQLVATGTAVSGVVDDNDVVVFITGQMHNGGNRSESFAQQSTSFWASTSSEPVFTRGATGNNSGNVSYSVVEFTGLNWKIQRVEHLFTAVGTTQTENITAVNSLSRTFIHTQKRYDGAISLADYGHDVWLSSIGAVSFFLEPSATTTGVNHYSVAWVVENTQTSAGQMVVQRSNGNTIAGGPEPVAISVPITTHVNATNNASIFLMTSLDSTGNQFPRVLMGATIVSTSTYQIWRSESANSASYRTEIVQWPAADLAVRQNYYRFYVDNDALLPTDPWPAGATDLGENTSVGALDEPLADGDVVRIRMSAKVTNATLPAGLLETKLQYALRDTTCSAVTVWSDVGSPASGEIWRGYDASGVTDGDSLSGNPPTGGDLLISISDRAGRYTETGPSAANQYAVYDGEDIEYDWIIEQNGASQRKTYCFRMVKSDDTQLDGYFHYPEIRTEGFTPVVDSWRWYDDETNETPTTALAAENIAPTNVSKGNAVKLRVTLDEIKNLSQINARFKLQFAEEADFSDVQDVVASTSCIASSVWCYYDGAGIDNDVITSSVLSGSDSCVAGVGAGCGTYNESSEYYNGFTHGASNDTEYEFTLVYTNVTGKFGKVYYFRLYDIANDEVVVASSTNPTLAGESTSLVFSVDGVDANTTIAGIVTDATTTATSLDFGLLPFDTDVEVAQEITVNTNATEGYQVYKYVDQQLLNSYSDQIQPITGTNAVPVSWGTGCSGSAVSCSGYHTTDATLEGGSGRFAPTDSYAALSTSLSEIMYSSVPSVDVENIIYRLRIGALQPIGDYTTTITYIAVPVF